MMKTFLENSERKAYIVTGPTSGSGINMNGGPRNFPENAPQLSSSLDFPIHLPKDGEGFMPSESLPRLGRWSNRTCLRLN